MKMDMNIEPLHVCTLYKNMLYNIYEYMQINRNMNNWTCIMIFIFFAYFCYFLAT